MGQRQCLFCENAANSREHVWPDWILERLKDDRRQAMSGYIGDQSLYWTGVKPELKTKCVCSSCNHGWMSTLENANIPVLGPLMHDLVRPIDTAEQASVARWAMKTAMVMESSTRRHRPIFYTRTECAQLRETPNLPFDTSVWIGRYAGQYNIAFVGTDAFDKKPVSPDALHGYVNTILFGYVVIQIISFHRPASFDGSLNIKVHPAPWDKLLFQLWPCGKPVCWPPPLTFSDTGMIGLGDLIRRWEP
jgi:hypothetical protein